MPDALQNSDELSSLERARERLYAPGASGGVGQGALAPAAPHALPHAWQESVATSLHSSRKRVRLAGFFFTAAFAFFLVALGVSGYLLYFGGNSVSVNNVAVDINGPTTIAGGDILPLSLVITNHNSVALDNATIEIDFPAGTRSADNVLTDYPRYTENLGTLAPGASVTRSVKAVVFGAGGAALALPVSLSYSTAGSSAVFVKKTTYALAVSTTPLSIAVLAPAESVSGQSLTLTLTVRSNASTPLDNVLVVGALPFGFEIASSSVPMNGQSFALGTLAPGDSKTINITGTLGGTPASTSAFNFSVGTAGAANATTLGVVYMQQSATVALAAPFIATTLAINGDSSGNEVLAPGTEQNVTLSYSNTLATPITNAAIDVLVSGVAIDYASIRANNGFYQSETHTIHFGSDTEPALASLAPGASGLATFSFSTLPSGKGGASPAVTLTVSSAGTRTGETNVPENVSAASVTTFKVASSVSLAASALHNSGSFSNTGPIPPKVGSVTTYNIVWNIQASSNAIAGATVSATLPSYVSYTGKTSGTLSFDSASRTVTWNAGNIAAGASAKATFQIAFTPSSTQRGAAPTLVNPASLTGFDRYAQTQISAQAEPVTTETPSDPGYVANDATVQ